MNFQNEDLFNITQQFFSGQYKKVSATSLDEFSEESQEIAKFYKYRSAIITGDFDVSELGSTTLDNILKEYAKIHAGKTSDIESLITDNADTWYVQILGSFYYIKNEKFENAIKLLQRHENSLENVLLLVQIYIHLNKLELAQKEIEQASEYANDSIIYNLADSYLNSVLNGEKLRGSLYFFEEFSHQFPSIKNLVNQFVLNLQLKQIPEAEVVLGQLQDLQGSNENMLANEITLANIVGDLKNAKEKRVALEKLNPQHPTIADFKSKNELFDSIVTKYSEQITN